MDLDRGIVIGEMCHIRGKNPGSARYDQDMDEDERDAYPNLVILCRNHHKLVDDAPDEFPPEILEKWKRIHEERSPDAPELSPKLLDQIIAEVEPSYLLAHIENSELARLNEVLDWQPHREYPEEAIDGTIPIVFSLDDLKMLNNKLSSIYQIFITNSMQTEGYDWSLTEIAQATKVVTKITHIGIQYYQVEGDRRKSELFEEP